MDQIRATENTSCASIKKPNKNSASPIDKDGSSIFPVTPFSYEKSVNSTSKNDDGPFTPIEDVIDPFARQPNNPNHIKDPETSGSYVARKLDFPSDITPKKRVSKSEFETENIEDGSILETVYESIMESVICKQTDEILDEILTVDLLMTPPSAVRLTGIAETCPGAPMKPVRKFRNVDSRLCRKLDFDF